MAEITFDIVKEIGVLSETNSGWRKEVNLISWNEREPVYDIRTWSDSKDKAGKGVTLTVEEIKKLKEIIDSLDLD